MTTGPIWHKNFYFGVGVNKLQSVVQIWMTACFYTAYQLRMVFTFMESYNKRRCDKDCMWSIKPKIFTIWPPLQKMFNNFEKKKNSISTCLNSEKSIKFLKTLQTTKKSSGSKRKTIPELNNNLVIQVSVLMFLEYCLLIFLTQFLSYSQTVNTPPF